MKSQRFSIVSIKLGPQRFTIEFPDRRISVQTYAESDGSNRLLFSFATDTDCLIDGHARGTQGILHLNDVEIATIVPNLVPTKTRMRFRAPAVRLGTLTILRHCFPSCASNRFCTVVHLLQCKPRSWPDCVLSKYSAERLSAEFQGPRSRVVLGSRASELTRHTAIRRIARPHPSTARAARPRASPHTPFRDYHVFPNGKTYPN